MLKDLGPAEVIQPLSLEPLDVVVIVVVEAKGIEDGLVQLCSGSYKRRLA